MGRWGLRTLPAAACSAPAAPRPSGSALPPLARASAPTAPPCLVRAWPLPPGPGSPADARRRADGAVRAGGRGGDRCGAEALARVHKPRRGGRSFGEGGGREVCQVRRGGWCEGGGGECGQRRQAGGAVPRGGGHRVPMLLLADAVEDLPCVTWSHSSGQTLESFKTFYQCFLSKYVQIYREVEGNSQKNTPTLPLDSLVPNCPSLLTHTPPVLFGTAPRGRTRHCDL